MNVVIMSSQKKYAAFELVFCGQHGELDELITGFGHVQGVSQQTRPLDDSGVVFRGGPHIELIIKAVALAGEILAISDIVVKWLDKRKDTVIRVGKREIRLKGVWKSQEIADILNAISKRNKKEALKQIAETDSATLAHLNLQLSELEPTISEYEKIVKGFEDIPKKKEWQRKKLKEYRKRLTSFKMKAENLRVSIDSLKREPKLTN